MGNKRNLFLGLSLLVLLVSGCGKGSKNENSVMDRSEISKTTQTPKKHPNDRTMETATANEDNVVHLRNNREAEFQGMTISDLTKLPNQIARKLFDGNQKEDLSVELALSADQETTFELLKKTLHSFQLYGFRNLRFRCGNANITIPTAGTSSSDEPISFSLTINSSENGEFCGMKIDRGGKQSWLESGDLDHAVKHAEKRLQEFVEQIKSSGDGSTQEIDIEIYSPPKVSARTYLRICGELHTRAQILGESSALSIRFWPMGYPKE